MEVECCDGAASGSLGERAGTSSLGERAATGSATIGSLGEASSAWKEKK